LPSGGRSEKWSAEDADTESPRVSHASLEASMFVEKRKEGKNEEDI